MKNLSKSFNSLTNPPAITRVMSFTSGKGGVGKSNTVINTAIHLARQGRSVLLLDADLGLANLDVLLGIRPKGTLFDFLNGECSLEEIILTGPEGISIIPASSGIESMCSLTTEQRLMLLDGIERIAANFDYLLIDTPAGINPEVLYFNASASEIVCVINDEPTSLTDAYAMIKILSRNYGEQSISILVNNTEGQTQAESAFGRLSRAVARFLCVDLKYIGFVPEDSMLREAVRSQKAVSEVFPSSPSALAYARVAKRLDESFLEGRIKGGMQLFFRQILEVSQHG